MRLNNTGLEFMQIRITKPDDWHLHLRDGDSMTCVAPHSAAQFSRALIMPNLKPPVTNADAAEAYRNRILNSLPNDSTFDPKMALYLTDNTSIDDVKAAANNPNIIAFKLYPAGATTNSSMGVSDVKNIYPILEAIQQHDLVLCIHGEIASDQIDIFDREKSFLDSTLEPITKSFPELRIVLEHITTAESAQFVTDASKYIASTITPQHLLFNRNAMLAGGIRPHLYCLPIIKREKHRIALCEAIKSGSSKFFLGTDSAPHSQSLKENSCGCAGVFSAHAAIEFYACAFEKEGVLDKLEAFSSFHGADFYQLPRNTDSIILEKSEWKIPENYSFAEDKVIPLGSGETLPWKMRPAQ